MRWGLVVVVVVVLSGCGERAYIQYQGRDAQTALECRAGYEAAKDRGENTVVAVPNSGAGFIAIAVASGIVSGSMESAYNQCLSRVATLQPGGLAGPPAPASQAFGTFAPTTPTARPVGCAPGGGPFQGGTGYCVGR